jgi:hypothetical protein
MNEWRTRTAEIIGGVLQEALTRAERDGIVLLDDGSTQSRLLREWSTQALGDTRVWSVSLDEGETR